MIGYTMPWTWVVGTDATRWDYGVRHFTRRISGSIELPVDPDFVANEHIRVSDSEADSNWVEQAIQIAAADCEACDLSFGRGVRPYRAVSRQVFEMWLSGFPASGRIQLQRAPVVSVDAVNYRNEDGDEVELVGSPAEYAFVPSGAYTAAEIRPLADGEFPSSTQTRDDALVITYTAGYTRATVPPLVRAGIQIMAAEMYKQRSLSVLGVNNNQAVLGDLRRFWSGPF